METIPSHAKVKESLEGAIKNCNRNLYSWMNENSLPFYISHNEVYGLTKNWIMRHLRGLFDSCTINRVFKRGRLIVSVDPKNYCISSIFLTNTDEIRGRDESRAALIIKTVLEEIKPSDLAYHKVSENGVFNSRVPLIDFSKIENIKF